MPKSPPAMTMVLPGFWLLVPGGMGLIGFAEIFGADGDSALPSTLISMIAVSLGIQAGLAVWAVLTHRARFGMEMRQTDPHGPPV
jgi:uncharacterized membrane protein YjjB (DUF3815 family)